MKGPAKAATVVVAAAMLIAGAAALNLRGAAVLDLPAPGLPRTTTSVLLGPAGRAGSLEGSIAALQDRLRLVPEDWQGYASLGLAYVAQARVTADPSWYPKAEGVLATSLRLHGEGNVDAVLGLGALALARHEFRHALARGRAAVDMSPQNADAFGVVGDALLELGRYEEAFEAFQTMVDTRPDLSSYARVSYARELLGDVGGAVDAMRTAFESAGSASDAAWAAHQLGELELGRGDVEAATGWFERGLDLDPDQVANLAGLARSAWVRGDARLAIERFEEVVALRPSVDDVASLGDLYATTGRPDLAEAQYAVVEAARELARSNGVNVDLEIALFDADHGDPGGALAAARAEWQRRKSIHVADAYAWALYANGRFQDAERLSDRALSLGTRNAMFLYHAAMIERALGRESVAIHLLNRVLALNPRFSVLHAAIAERVRSELEART
jgi:tetratricopeptide (TPR) repeat protein